MSEGLVPQPSATANEVPPSGPGGGRPGCGTVPGAGEARNAGPVTNEGWDTIKKMPMKLADGTTTTPEEYGIESLEELVNSTDPNVQAFAGGFNDPNVTYAAAVLAEDIPQFNRITAQNDIWHQRNRPNSLHTDGVKIDITFDGGTWRAQQARRGDINNVLSERFGLVPGRDFVIVDEPHGTGPHSDIKFLPSGIRKIERVRLGL